ncbi:preprotein translocase subunit SecA [Dehalococcoides mccartyi]|uniref:Protein translocase subunit SecA n=1 Tax=Dehalococcoides mccartyi TaxID=61435 RepID=A0A142V9B9_9CHLR|nr:preprotein translocase subunit SecA [Dehalococcoides mccartyi]AMU86201.1 preprotein translocuse subunit SecA [Dehalococcoides mccartyi]AOV99040.1 protein export cytoplasm protein SecA ATPase RNA helicase [Dehalococcoides mccartyi]MBA2084812.1 Protein translocase subunit SecA [Dehalococcoides mccartyi]QBX63550.1 preprotein translocase subunit SecA [Dehalococcoides mccartyi]BCT55586.1 protein translocase subunit SecA [Dehalococcoides mccartyi]
MFKFFSSFGDSNEKEIRALEPLVDKINQLENSFTTLSDEALKAKTIEFRARLKNTFETTTAGIQEDITSTTAELAEAQKIADNSKQSRLKAKLESLNKDLSAKENTALNGILPEAFAAVREASRRTIGLRHYDVQLIGGMVLHHGKIAEMRTGEGKTLVATLPLYLNSLLGKGVHLVTVNDYLARRDAYWMGPVYHALGVSVSSIYPMQTPTEELPSRLFDPDYTSEIPGDPWTHFRPISRQEAYKADITYGTSTEFGFDYLRDNLRPDLAQCVQRDMNYAIVDEIDNLLIDEARTPLIISAPDTEAGKLYDVFARLSPRLVVVKDYEINEKDRNAELTEDGWANVEKLLSREGVMKGNSLYDPQNAPLIRHLRNALSAKEFYKKDHQYVVKEGEIIIIDEFTGRMMLGRRYSEGLHQAIEAKEHVKVQQESKTYATVTIQNLFRMYRKLCGMTGTAATEAEEFSKIYKLEVVIIPTNKPAVREDYGDQIYKDQSAKFKAVVNEIDEMRKLGRPVLVGTVSIENSEMLSNMLKRQGIEHKVLNAKQHEKEAQVVAEAGKPGAVTVATNMAGRGVDILLGGKEPTKDDAKVYNEWQAHHQQVLEAGGLHVIGTERHESRRIDNQLRGRSGRQGDPGSSRFYVALDDDIMRRFGSERIQGIMEWAGMDENTPIENGLVSRTLENAQKRVEGYHFDVRKHLVEYDDVVNKHREVIYAERRKILSGADLKSNILDMIREEIITQTAEHTRGYDSSEWNLDGLVTHLNGIFTLPAEINAEALAKLSQEEITDLLTRTAEELYQKKEDETGAGSMRLLERIIMLHTLDSLWVEHLTIMENLRREIGLQAFAQRDPLIAYKNEGHVRFQELLETIKHDVVHNIYRIGIQIQHQTESATAKAASRPVQQQKPLPAAPAAAIPGVSAKAATQSTTPAAKEIGRNDPCPCGSGKKYKKCCGK